MSGHDDSTATILFALSANALIAAAKGTAAWVTGSTAMLAVAVHSVADCGNQGLLLLGLNRFALRVGQSADPALQQEIHRFLTAREEVAEVLNLITLQNGADAVVTVKARMTENASAPVLVDAINRCERTVRAAFPQVRWLFFEPDVEQ